MKIGVISDTHGYLDPKVAGLVDGVDHILHAGDIGPHSLIVELEHIAPVTAVLGNTDFGLTVRETEIVEFAGFKFLINHIVDPYRLEPMFKERVDRQKPDAIVFGHTHKPFNETIGGILYFNPGYAGQQRFKLGRSLAIFHCEKKKIRPEFFDLG